MTSGSVAMGLSFERSGLLERDGAGSYVAGSLFWLYAARHDPWDETVRLARDAGYGYALTTQAAWAGPATDPFRIPRLVLDPAVDDLRLLKRSVAALISGRAPRAGHR